MVPAPVHEKCVAIARIVMPDPLFRLAASPPAGPPLPLARSGGPERSRRRIEYPIWTWWISGIEK